MNNGIIIFAALILVGCAESTTVDQCMRLGLFKQCLAAIPAGPQSTKYNDWSEVVEQCGRQSYYQSLRAKQHVKPECRL